MGKGYWCHGANTLCPSTFESSDHSTTMNLDRKYWEDRYANGDTPWDIGEISPPLRDYFDGLEDRQLRILIPGAGRAHEAAYLHQKGFCQVWVCDLVDAAFDQLRQLALGFPEDHLISGDFFHLTGYFDLVVEQTFFCALEPQRRPAYVDKMSDLLEKGGILVGLLFSNPFPKPGPPFGGTPEEYKSLFEHRFTIKKLEACKNSILPRSGNECFVQLINK